MVSKAKHHAVLLCHVNALKQVFQEPSTGTGVVRRFVIYVVAWPAE